MTTDLDALRAVGDGGVVNLVNSVHRMAEVMHGMDIGGDVFGGFSCAGIEAVADVLRAVGEGEVADQIIEWHGRSDEDPEDMHHEFYRVTLTDRTGTPYPSRAFPGETHYT